MPDIEILPRGLVPGGDIAGGNTLAAKIAQERARGLGQRHSVLRAFRAGQAGDHRAHVQLHRVGKHRVRRACLAEHALRAQIRLHQRNPPLVTAGQP